MEKEFELDITVDEVMEILTTAFKEAKDDGEAGVTRYELQKKLKWSDKRTLKYLREQVETGRIKPVYVKRRNMHGEPTTVKGYALSTLTDS